MKNKRNGSRLFKPKLILIFVLFMGVLLNVGYFIYKILPASQVVNVTETRYQQLEAQRIALDKVPIPARISAQSIEKLVQQVPTIEEISRLILSLQGMESSTGAIIRLFSVGADSKGDDELNKLYKEIIPSANTAQPNIQTTDAQKPADPKSADTVANQAIVEENVNLTISGTYSQIIDFVKQLNQNERIINLTHFTMESYVDKLKQENAGFSTNNLYGFTMHFSIYIAKKYADRFKALDPISVTPPEPRIDPTMSDAGFFSKLIAK